MVLSLARLVSYLTRLVQNLRCIGFIPNVPWFYTQRAWLYFCLVVLHFSVKGGGVRVTASASLGSVVGSWSDGIREQVWNQKRVEPAARNVIFRDGF